METREIVPCSAIISPIWVHFADYSKAEDLKNSLLPLPPAYCVRFIAYAYDGGEGIRSVQKRHRVLAELEPQQLTRDYVLTTFVSHPSHVISDDTVTLGEKTPLNAVRTHTPGETTRLRRISIPYSIFLDVFGLYRNAYYSLKGMYITPAGMDAEQRTRLYNVLMISPFSPNETEIAGCLEMDELHIRQGCATKLDSGETVFVTAFPLHTGDMPQQNQNSGNKT